MRVRKSICMIPNYRPENQLAWFDHTFDRSIQESDLSRRQVDSITNYAECDAGASSVEENKRWKQVGHVCSIVLTSKHFVSEKEWNGMCCRFVARAELGRQDRLNAYAVQKKS